jgi:hypothetical protein
MKTSTYIKLCAAVTTLWVLGLVFVTPFAQAVEALIHVFLATNAS